MERQLIKYVLARRDFGATVTVAGWVRTRRDSKAGFSFLELNDGSCLAALQVIADGSLPNYRTRSCSCPPGRPSPSPASWWSRPARASPSSCGRAGDRPRLRRPRAYPLQKKQISFERLREIAHLRPRTNTFGAVARVRNALAFATHRFFQERDFLYLHTPIITASDCEGAGEMFQVTTLDPGPRPATRPAPSTRRRTSSAGPPSSR